jgi:hypothetical protein
MGWIPQVADSEVSGFPEARMKTSFPLMFGIALAQFLAQGVARGDSINVLDRGAKGDLAPLTAKTVAGSEVISSESASFSKSDLGKVIELHDAGTPTSGGHHQDLVARIIEVVDVHSIRIRPATGASLPSAGGEYGTDNAPIFTRLLNDCRGSNNLIKVPTGNYLLMAPAHFQSDLEPTEGAVVIHRGGFQIVGEGMDRTILTGCGAWQLGQGNRAYRGFLLVCRGPVSNDYPVVFKNLTLDGGVTQGNTTNHGFPASAVDGEGWDLIHSAVVDMGPPPLNSSKTFSNIRFTHWRGEEVKSVCANWDGFINMQNCQFTDGNASGFNFSFTHQITGCLFSNLFLISEFYQAYHKRPCLFESNTATVLTSGGIAINGGTGTNPPYYIQNNDFTFMAQGGNGIMTCPADNLIIRNNQFHCAQFNNAIAIGCAGYQGSFWNRNIVIAGNTFTGPRNVIQLEGSGQNRSEAVCIVSNTSSGPALQVFLGGYTNSSASRVVVSGNKCLASNTMFLGGYSPQYALILTNNEYHPFQDDDGVGKTNVISVASGPFHQTVYTRTNSVYVLDDSFPDSIPYGAQIVVDNSVNHFGLGYPLYPSTRSHRKAVPVKNGEVMNFYWNSSKWSTNRVKPDLSLLKNAAL